MEPGGRRFESPATRGGIAAAAVWLAGQLVANLLDSLRDDGFSRVFAVCPPGLELGLGPNRLALPQIGQSNLPLPASEVLKSGTVDNSLRAAGDGFERKNAKNGGKTPGFRPIQITWGEFFAQWQRQDSRRRSKFISGSFRDKMG